MELIKKGYSGVPHGGKVNFHVVSVVSDWGLCAATLKEYNTKSVPKVRWTEEGYRWEI